MKRLTYSALGIAVLAGATLTAQAIQINGAGATFPYPIYQKWFAEYNKLHGDIRTSPDAESATSLSVESFSLHSPSEFNGTFIL